MSEIETVEHKVPTGPDIIKKFVRTLPGSSGVYRMFDANGQVIYVGKARNLKARVTNYTRFEGNPVRICRMIAATASMEFVTTETEAEALLLEANLIKRLRPRFNVLLRDDKSFPYILLATDHEAPQILKHRGTRRRKGFYFGPFASATAVERTIAALQKAFLLRNCTDSFYAGRSRPCLQHQIKRCAAPCTGEISLEDYGELVQSAKQFLEGKSRSVQAHLSEEMNEAAEDLDFERAATIRDRLSALALIQSQGDSTAQTLEEADIFAIHQQAGQFCVQVFFFRAHQNWGNHAFRPRADASLSEADVLGPFLVQFYENRTPPRMVLLSHEIEDAELIAEVLSEKAGRKVTLGVPQRGEKRDLVDNALVNAREALGRQLSESASQKKLLEGLKETFGLPRVPRRIETYDNSHIQGTNAIGAMVVAGEDGFSKKHYRTFNIKSEDLTPGDDFGMMQEVLTRRFKRLANEVPEPDNVASDDEEGAATEGLPDWPDVLLIDGGLGQLNAVREVFRELGLKHDISLIGIAKGEERNAGRETFFMQGREPFMLPARDPVLYYVQRLRDEAHRFAIGTHRAKRNKAMVKNPLDEIDGIGPTRKRALLNHFGSAKAVSRAALNDLMAIDGISKTMAQQIYDHFNRAE
ncbi:MAG: excinuclease ABC subunit UvrC [Hyphomicrobiaceae bacterium]|nr:excinuclease ABC subunit UvrC [Hyphomicrobiaceae bacterium]MCC0023273.1 excinuclease ABC subunit UvrC [Hyphomicrobiaceae bacterium]